MKDIFRNLFTFSAGERKGILVLILVVILIIGYNLFLMLHHAPIRQEEIPTWMNDTEAVMADAAPDFSNVVPVEVNQPDAVREISENSFLDPNEASFETLQYFGLGKRVSRNILHYRAKGGRFRTAEDLKKIYGMDPGQVDRISKHIRISAVGEKVVKQAPAVKKSGTRIIEVNLADSAGFENLPGIGPVLARRIIRYRALLGGFYSPRQIREVYGITDSLYCQVADMLVADTAQLKKINLNTVNEKDLARHPYVGRYNASGIIRYRNQVTRIKSPDELKMNGLIREEVFDKIKNYLTI